MSKNREKNINVFSGTPQLLEELSGSQESYGDRLGLPSAKKRQEGPAMPRRLLSKLASCYY